jgi:hypothetical protein
MDPEQKARLRIDQQLELAGWIVLDYRDLHITAGRLLGTKQAGLDRLLDHIAAMNTDEAELFATAYAAWNDLLIDGRPADEKGIIAEIYGWHESKKKFTLAAIRERLEWMRLNRYVATGQGEKTKHIGKNHRKVVRRRA